MLLSCLPQKATVTLMWPHKIQTEGFGARKVLAERYAAAAACQKLRASTLLSEMSSGGTTPISNSRLQLIPFFALHANILSGQVLPAVKAERFVF